MIKTKQIGPSCVSVDAYINLFLEENKIDSSNLIDIKYSSHGSSGGYFSALIIYKEKYNK